MAALAFAIPINFLFLMSTAQQSVPKTLPFNMAELLLLGALTVSLMRRLPRLRGGDSLFLAYFTWCALVVAYHWVFVPESPDEVGRYISSFSRGVLTLQVFWYLIGRNALEQSFSTRTLLAVYAVLLLSVALHTNPETLGVDFQEIDDDGLNYLAVADPFAIWAFLLLARLAGWRFLIVAASALVAVFLIGSRGTLYAMLGAGFLYGLIVAPRVWFTVGASAVVAAGVFLGSVIDDVADLGRMFALVSISQDPSFLERVDMRERGLERIAENPLTGDYGGAVRDFGNIGAYVHDVTSYWQQFGLVPFALVVVLLALSGVQFWRAARRIRTCRADHADHFLALYFPFVAIQMVAARAYDWPFFWLLVGLAVARAPLGGSSLLRWLLGPRRGPVRRAPAAPRSADQ